MSKLGSKGGDLAAPPTVQERQFSIVQIQPQQTIDQFFKTWFLVHSTGHKMLLGQKTVISFDEMLHRIWWWKSHKVGSGWGLGTPSPDCLTYFMIRELFNKIVFAVFVVSPSFWMMFEIIQIIVLVNTPGPNSIFCISAGKRQEQTRDKVLVLQKWWFRPLNHGPKNPAVAYFPLNSGCWTMVYFNSPMNGYYNPVYDKPTNYISRMVFCSLYTLYTQVWFIYIP